MIPRGTLPFLLAVACVAVALAPTPVAASELPSGFRDDVVFSGLEEPTNLRFASDGRVFVAEKSGKIEVFDDLDDPTPTLFADLRTQVYDAVDRGLLGLALDPDFPDEPYVYAFYTYDHVLGEGGEAPKWGEEDDTGDICPRPDGIDVDECPVSSRLVRLTAEGGGDHAVESGGQELQEVLIEDWCQQFSSHSTGDLQFDADGNLYVSAGEGASFYDMDYGQFGGTKEDSFEGVERNQCGDPPGPVGALLSPPSAEGGALRAQDARTPADPTGLDGAVLRIDPDTGQGLPGNPMFGSLDANARRIIAYGFRNPFRFVVDPANDQLYVGNVGWGGYEEIDRVPATPSPAFNSGWPCYEGPDENEGYEGLGLNLCENLYDDPGAVTPPFFLYQHSNAVTPGDPCTAEAGSAISGLALYGGGPFPSAYDGALFFADSVRGCVYAMHPGGNGRPDPLNVTPFMSDGGVYPGIDLEVGPDGALYYAKLFDDSFGPGSIHRIAYEPDAPLARLTASPEWGTDDPLEVDLDAGDSTDPNGDALSYEWDLDGNGTFEVDTGGDSDLTHLFGGNKNVKVGVRVSDGSHVAIGRLTIYPGNTPPRPVIDQPLGSLEWSVGDQIDFSGHVDDDQDDLGANNLYWKTRLYHCPTSAGACHAHPLQLFPGVDEESFTAPDHDYPSYIEISLTATDSRGLSVTKSVKINPRAVNLQIRSDPAGLSLSAGPKSQVAPYTLTLIEGSSVTLSAPSTAMLGGREYTWSGWSDGGARVHTITADESASYTASYATPGGPHPPDHGGGSGLRVSLDRHPPKRTRRSTAQFAFSASSDGATFHCKLDERPFHRCHSPRRYKRLAVGRHVFRVFAESSDGKTRSAAATFPWKVLHRQHRHARR